MRVVHVVAGCPQPGGAHAPSRYVYFLAPAQAALDLDVAVLGLTPEAAVDVEGVRVKTFRPARFPFAVPAPLHASLTAWPPDVLHLHGSHVPAWGLLAAWARRARIPYVVSPHGGLAPGARRQRRLLKLPYETLVLRRLLDGAAFLHAVGTSEGLDRLGAKAPVVPAPSGIDPDLIPPDVDRHALAARHGVLRGRRVFLYVGRLDPAQKGLDLLLRAFRDAGLEHAALVLAGPDHRGGRATLEHMARRIRAPVLFLGPLHGRMVFDCLAGADVFVHPSRWEGMAAAVLEAAAVGLPCLLTPPADPWGKLARTGGATVVAPEVGNIAEALRAFAARTEDELRAMGERARAGVAGFTWDAPARILADAYARATRGAPRPAEPLHALPS